MPESELPSNERRDDPPQVAVLTKLLSVAVGNLAAEADVDTALLATTSDLQEIVRWFLDSEGAPRPEVLEGWRGEILQESLIGFLEGRKVMRVGNVRRPNPLVFEPFPRNSFHRERRPELYLIPAAPQPQACHQQHEQPAGRAQDVDEWAQMVHPQPQLLLFFFQVRFRAVQKELIVFVHGERAAVNQQYHQHRRQHAPQRSSVRTSVPYSHLRRPSGAYTGVTSRLPQEC